MVAEVPGLPSVVLVPLVLPDREKRDVAPAPSKIFRSGRDRYPCGSTAFGLPDCQQVFLLPSIASVVEPPDEAVTVAPCVSDLTTPAYGFHWAVVRWATKSIRHAAGALFMTRVGTFLECLKSFSYPSYNNSQVRQ